MEIGGGQLRRVEERWSWIRLPTQVFNLEILFRLRHQLSEFLSSSSHMFLLPPKDLKSAHRKEKSEREEIGKREEVYFVTHE